MKGAEGNRRWVGKPHWVTKWQWQKDTKGKPNWGTSWVPKETKGGSTEHHAKGKGKQRKLRLKERPGLRTEDEQRLGIGVTWSAAKGKGASGSFWGFEERVWEHLGTP